MTHLHVCTYCARGQHASCDPHELDWDHPGTNPCACPHEPCGCYPLTHHACEEHP